VADILNPRRDKAAGYPPANWVSPLTIDAMATTIAATINTKSNAESKRIARKLRIFLIIVRVYGGHLNQF
jgi:hypothetical protein